MGVRLQKTKKAEFLIEAEKNHGIINETLSKVGVSKHYYYMWIKNDPEFAESVGELAGKTKDFVESQLFKLIKGGDRTSCIFWLKCHGGYIETQHIKQETTFTEPLRINVIAPSIEPLKIEGEEQKKLNE